MSHTVKKSECKPKVSKVDKRIMGIDIGMKNIAAITSNVFSPVLLSGNRLYQILDTYKECYATMGYGRFAYYNRRSSKRYLEKRNDKLEEYLISCVDTLMKKALDNDITHMVIGYQKEWGSSKKFDVSSVDKMTQRVLCRFKDMIKKRCSKRGIAFIEIDESFTSKCSFIDDESIERHKSYNGERTDRDTYITKSGHIINADVNASLNIIKKFLCSNNLWCDMYRYQLLGTLVGSKHCTFKGSELSDKKKVKTTD